jgi:hypothetical protein
MWGRDQETPEILERLTDRADPQRIQMFAGGAGVSRR